MNVENILKKKIGEYLSKNYSLSKANIEILKTRKEFKGDYTVVWNGTDRQGRLMPSGVYFLEINNNNSKMVKPVTLLK